MDVFTPEQKYKIQSVVDLFTKHFPFRMNGKTLETLVVQGGMGVDVSGVDLANAVAKTGSAGTVSTTLSQHKDLLKQIDTTQIIGINHLVSTIDYEECYTLGQNAGADYIASGAGFNMAIAKRAKNQATDQPHYWTIPIISNVTQLLKRLPLNWGYIILENTDSGGHNGAGVGFEQTLEECRHTVIDKQGNKVIFAGGVRTSTDFVRAIDHGFDAVQMGTVFLASTEADFKYKNMIIHAGEAGMPAATRVPSVAGLAASGFPFGVIEGTLRGQKYERYTCANNNQQGCLINCNLIKTSAGLIGLDPEKMGDYCILQALRAANKESTSTYPPLVFSGMHPEKLPLSRWLPDGKPIPAKEIIAKYLQEAYDAIIDGYYRTKGYVGKILDEHRAYLEERYNAYKREEGLTLTAKVLCA